MPHQLKAIHLALVASHRQLQDSHAGLKRERVRRRSTTA